MNATNNRTGAPGASQRKGPTGNTEATRSPPGTAAGERTSGVDEEAQVEPSPVQLEQGRAAKKDLESPRVNTDRYDTSGNDNAPPKTPDE